MARNTEIVFKLPPTHQTKGILADGYDTQPKSIALATFNEY